MASTTSSLILPLPKPLHTVRNSVSSTPKPVSARPSSTSRRDFLLFTTTTSFTALTLSPAANAKDIPLFGLRKKLEKAEEQAEEIVKEGIEAAEKSLEAAEKGLETAEKQVVKAEKEIEGVADGGSVGALAQAGIVVAAELFAVLVATSVVSGILGPEPKST